MNYQRTSQNSRQDRRNPGSPTTPFNTNSIKLVADNLPTNLFSQVAEDAAKYVAEWDAQLKRAGKNASKPTQLRKFYDEICMWDDKSQRNRDRFKEDLPFILMLKAKAAYSKGRKHVNEHYEKILNHCLDQLVLDQKAETLHNLKLFMEAFTGFYKIYKPKD